MKELAIMEKKQYISPLVGVTIFGSEVIMQAFGPASMPTDPKSSAPSLKVPALGNDSVPVF